MDMVQKSVGCCTKMRIYRSPDWHHFSCDGILIFFLLLGRFHTSYSFPQIHSTSFQISFKTSTTAKENRVVFSFPFSFPPSHLPLLFTWSCTYRNTVVQAIHRNGSTINCECSFLRSCICKQIITIVSV